MNEINQHLPQGKCLVEPFVGAGSVFLNTQFERYLLTDINPDLIALFNWVKNDVESYIAETRALFSHPDANSKDFYYAQRSAFNQSRDPQTRAALFLYLNRFGFNGLCRYNRKNEYNVPFGRYKKPYFPEQELRFFAEKAQNAAFLCADFQQTFDHLSQHPDDYVIYCDPPYAPLQQESNFTHYAGNQFGLEAQRQLAECARDSAQRYPVLISNHDTPFTREIYQGARLIPTQVQRSISQKGAGRKKVNELFALFIQNQK